MSGLVEEEDEEKRHASCKQGGHVAEKQLLENQVLFQH